MEKSQTYTHKYTEVTTNAPPGYVQATGQQAYPSNMGPPTGQYPMPVQQQPTVILQTAPAQGIRLGPNPTTVTCPSCHQTRVSQIRYESSTKTHLFATILCLTTCCCCIPYMIDSCKNANHICTNCGAYLGTYNN